MRVIVRLVSLLVPRSERPRWQEEWRAELQHGRWTMIFGALPDAWVMRKLSRPDDAGRPRSKHPFNAIDQDIRHALRTLRTARLFSVSVVASLSVGIAVTATAFIFLNATLFRPFPGIVEQDRLVVLDLQRGCGWPGCSIGSSTVEDYRELRAGMTLLDGELAASTIAEIAIGIAGRPHSVRAALVSENYLPVLGVQPALGRGFRQGGAGAAPEHAIVISHALWQREFGSDPGVLGRQVALASGAATVVGVAPPGFAGASAGERGARDQRAVETWIPIELADRVSAPLKRTPAGTPLGAPERHLRYLGRLHPSVDRSQVHAQAQVVAAQIAAHRPREGGGAWVHVTDLSMVSPRAVVPLTVAVLGVPLLVLLIACLNAANLLAARGASRWRELSVRLALGATRWRVVRALLVEGILLALVASTVSLVMARWSVRLIAAVFDLPMPIDGRVLLFTTGLAVLSAIAFSLLPALRLAATDPGRVIGSTRASDERGGRRGRRAFVVAQVALSLGLLASGTQLISFVEAEAPAAGTASDRLVLASFDVQQLGMTDAQSRTFYADLLQAASARPEIEAAGLARRHTLWTFGQGKGASPIIVWRPGDEPRQGRLYLGGYAGGDLFRAAGLAVLEGRAFAPADAVGQPRVAIVNRPLAATLFDGAPVLGRTIRVAARAAGYERAHEVTIVGIVEPALEPSYSSQPAPAAYVPVPLEPEPALTLHVAARGPALATADAIREVVSALNPRLPAIEVDTLEAIGDQRMRLGIMAARGISLLGLLALALAAAGLYAVMSFAVQLRSREIGIRIALGADGASVLRMVLGEAGVLVVTGTAIGLLGAFVVTKLEESEFHGIAGLDLSAFAFSTAVLTVALLLASALPARRASRVDPVTVLRNE